MNFPTTICSGLLWSLVRAGISCCSEAVYDDELPELGADHLVDVQGVGLHADVLLQLPLAANQEPLFLLRPDHGLAQADGAQTNRCQATPHGHISKQQTSQCDVSASNTSSDVTLRVGRSNAGMQILKVSGLKQ